MDAKRLSLISLIVTLLPILAQGASVSATQVPLFQSDYKLEKSFSDTELVARDGAIGVGVGALSGLGFSLMSQGLGPSSASAFRAEALGTGIFVGLIGGLATGFWQLKQKHEQQNAVKLMVNPGVNPQDPHTLGTQISF